MATCEAAAGELAVRSVSPEEAASQQASRLQTAIAGGLIVEEAAEKPAPPAVAATMAPPTMVASAMFTGVPAIPWLSISRPPGRRLRRRL